jgi:hypothetical protein
VREAVDLDRKANCHAVEVEHIGAGRMLATKLESSGSFPEFAPQY